MKITDIEVGDIFKVMPDVLLRDHGPYIEITAVDVAKYEISYHYTGQLYTGHKYRRGFPDFICGDFKIVPKEISIDTSPLFEDFEL